MFIESTTGVSYYMKHTQCISKNHYTVHTIYIHYTQVIYTNIKNTSAYNSEMIHTMYASNSSTQSQYIEKICTKHSRYYKSYQMLAKLQEIYFISLSSRARVSSLQSVL